MSCFESRFIQVCLKLLCPFLEILVYDLLSLYYWYHPHTCCCWCYHNIMAEDAGEDITKQEEMDERVLVVAGDVTGVLSSEEPTGYKIDTELLGMKYRTRP